MGRKKPQKCKRKDDKKQELWVDPARIRFQHSRLRPYFSGCGRSVTETLESIRRRELSPLDLPPIQVLVGPEDESGPWYFSLNNRRLWVLKRCREEGFLENNVIRVRVRAPKSDAELERYTLDNCAVEAKLMREKEQQQHQKVELIKTSNHQPSLEDGEFRQQSANTEHNRTTRERYSAALAHDKAETESDSDHEDGRGGGYTNRFSALM